MVHLLLLTAARGAGKTTACQRFVELARAADLRVGGILTPARYDSEGVKIGFDAVDVFTGEGRLLAEISREKTRHTVGWYHFHSQTMQWALERVLQALATPLDSVIVDEIGPLELEKGAGFVPVLDALEATRATSVILVVRRALLEALRERLANFSPVVVSFSVQTRGHAPERLFAQVWQWIVEN